MVRVVVIVFFYRKIVEKMSPLTTKRLRFGVSKTVEKLYKLKDEKQYTGLFFFHKIVLTFVTV